MGCYPSEGARIEDLLCQHTQQVGETKGLQNENLNSVIYLQNLCFFNTIIRKFIEFVTTNGFGYPQLEKIEKLLPKLFDEMLGDGK